MKISTRTLAAARKAAADQGMSLDSWANRVLANAAAANQPPNVEVLLREISRKIDELADRQGFGEKANEQLAVTVREIGSSFKQATKTTGRVLGEVGSKTGTAVGEMAGKAIEAIGQLRKSATELAATPSPPTAGEGEAGGGAAAKPRAAVRPRAKKGVKPKDTSRLRSRPRRQT